VIALGIDVGGTGVKGAPVDTETGLILAARHRIATPQPASPEAIAEVAAEIARHFSWSGPIGYGFPAIVKDGVTYSAANIDPSWVNTDAAALFTDATGCPTTIINDADAAGMAEMRFGAGCNRQGVVFVITLGTGIGTALFTDGHLVPNVELGHLKLRGKKDAESWGSDAARQKQKLSWKKWAKRLTDYFEELERLFSPALFIIGGGVSKKANEFLPLVKIETEMVPAQLRNNAGIVGAALAAARNAVAVHAEFIDL